MSTTVVAPEAAAEAATPSLQLVTFSVDGQRYALHLDKVERVIHLVAFTPLPDAPEVVPGVINMAGRVIPVVDLRRRFALPQRDFSLTDHLIIAAAGERTVALWVDTATGVVERPEEEIVPADAIVPGQERIEGVAKLPEGLVLIYDLKKCLSLEEEQQLQRALAAGCGRVRGQ